MEKYMVKYKMDLENHPGGFTKEEIKREGAGGCDAFVMASILRDDKGDPCKGTKNIAVLTYDGMNGKEIPDTELFQVFGHLAHYLMSEATLPPWQTLIAREAFQSIQETLVSRREKG